MVEGVGDGGVGAFEGGDGIAGAFVDGFVVVGVVVWGGWVGVRLWGRCWAAEIIERGAGV